MAIATALIGCTAIQAAHAQQTSSRHITVRSYNASSASTATIHRAEETASELLQNARIESRWRNCHMPDGPPQYRDGCADSLDAGELAVRIVIAPRTIADREVLGYSFVDPHEARGTLATVFADRVQNLAIRLRVERGTLLGRAIAHEIGHLLLGTTEHSERGLMRARWSAIGQPVDWLFSPDQAVQMRQVIAHRWGPILASADALSGQ